MVSPIDRAGTTPANDSNSYTVFASCPLRSLSAAHFSRVAHADRLLPNGLDQPCRHRRHRHRHRRLLIPPRPIYCFPLSLRLGHTNSTG